MTRGKKPDGSWQLMEYDSAGRLITVKRESDGLLLQRNQYGSSRERAASWNYVPESLRWYVWGGSAVLAEYTAPSWGWPMTWAKSYVYAGSRLLSTFTSNGAGGETLEFNHPDRLGTKLVTNNAANTSFEQSTLPFGTALNAESSGFSNQVFTSYERSDVANLDYAVNRTYSAGQGRFTTVDPIGMAAVSVGNPQSFNLFAYVRNAPTDLVDPSGLNLESPNVVVRIEKRVLNIERPDWFSTYWDDVFGANNGGSVDGDTGRRGPDDGGTVSIGGDGDGGDDDSTCVKGLLVSLYPGTANNLRFTQQPVPGDSRATQRKRFFAPEFAEKLSGVIDELNAQGIVPQVNSGFRTPGDLARVKGNGAGGNPIADNSLHGSGYAVDVNRLSNPKEFETIKKVFKANGFLWGGDFNGKKDPPHFYIDPYGGLSKQALARRVAGAKAALDYYNKTENFCWQK